MSSLRTARYTDRKASGRWSDAVLPFGMMRREDGRSRVDRSRRRQECSSEHALGLRVRALGVSVYLGPHPAPKYPAHPRQTGTGNGKPGVIAGGIRHDPAGLPTSATGFLQPVIGSASMHIGREQVGFPARYVNHVLWFRKIVAQDVASTQGLDRCPHRANESAPRNRQFPHWCHQPRFALD